MSSRPKRRCKATNPPHLEVSKTLSPSKVMDPVSNESVPVCQEEDSNMSPQPLIIDESNEVNELSNWKRKAEMLQEDNSALHDNKIMLLELAVQEQKEDFGKKITALESERDRLKYLLSVVEGKKAIINK
ncbi:hypothetical protein GHT06_022526 [Daphnia sinensis]|uniref:Uncharacterized protein n=1 Tax=Daphnia sinensis TaxID=1820382 RepID=A0AAD5KHQ6_9CRUS|nr:hypothetical protein GHT06_022526 [Daphnia sinensis]